MALVNIDDDAERRASILKEAFPSEYRSRTHVISAAVNALYEQRKDQIDITEPGKD